MAFTKKPRSGGFKDRKSFGDKKPWDRGGDRGSRGNDRGSYGRDFEKPQLFKATCAKCHESCQVPFKPNGSKPVLCSNCFSKNNDRGSSDDYKPSYDRPERSERSSGNYNPENKSNDKMKEQLNILNSKLDLILKTLKEMNDDGDEF